MRASNHARIFESSFTTRDLKFARNLYREKCALISLINIHRSVPRGLKLNCRFNLWTDIILGSYFSRNDDTIIMEIMRNVIFVE